MPCYHPIRMLQLKAENSNGKRSIVSYSQYKPGIGKNIDLPCGRCNGCRLERARQWAVRCVNEMSLWKRNSFITLTYADDALVYGGADHGILVPDHLTKFWKRLRKRTSTWPGASFRYFACGEYGDKYNRPHYHAVIFGFDFPDKKYDKTSDRGDHYYHSDSLDRLWGHGHCTIGDATFESASYVARYIMKKHLGKESGLYEERGITPEFVVMSRRPGIGAEYYDRYESDMFPRDLIHVRNKIAVPPQYYTRRYRASHPIESEDMIDKRIERAEKNWQENVPKRLRVRERIKRSQIKSLSRDLESH